MIGIWLNLIDCWLIELPFNNFTKLSHKVTIKHHSVLLNMINEKLYILKQKDYIIAILNLNFLLELVLIEDDLWWCKLLTSNAIGLGTDQN